MMTRTIVFGWAVLLLLLLCSCVNNAPDSLESALMGIEDIEWLLLEVSGVQIAPSTDERRPFIRLDPAKKEALGYAGCNNFFCTYDLAGSSLKFGPVGATRMACPDLPMSLETEVFIALDKTTSWNIRDGVLLLLNDGKVLARLATKGGEKSAALFTGTLWQWVQTLYNDDRKVVPSDSSHYTVQFREDGTISVKADCNMKGGTYSTSAQEKRLSIEITHSTMAACPEGSLEDEFVRGLSAAALFFFRDGDLYIDLQYDSGTMRFSK